MKSYRLVLVTAAALTASVTFAADVYLSIGGSVGNFRTDARIFNPSSEKSIQLNAWLLPVGNNDNSAVQPRTITVPARSMLVLDDVVASVFNGSGIGAIRLASADDYVATQRIYAQTEAGTLGQFVPGIPASSALRRGVLIQLKSSGSFRSNVGAVNPNATPAVVTWKVRDRENRVVAEGAPITMPPYGVIGPTSVTSGFFFDTAGADLSDAWVSFTSDQPIIAYASVIDNLTTDPTFITAAEDTGEDPVQVTKTFDVEASQFTFSISPAFNVSVGDEVTLRLSSTDVTHGFTLIGPDGATLVPAVTMSPGQAALVRTFKAQLSGTYSYFCTHTLCGSGHAQMTGAFNVAAGKSAGAKR